jgi:hypothetical protein
MTKHDDSVCTEEADDDWVYVTTPRSGSCSPALDEPTGCPAAEPAAEVCSPIPAPAGQFNATFQQVASLRAPLRSYAEAVCAGPFNAPPRCRGMRRPMRMTGSPAQPRRQAVGPPLPRWGECQFPMF